MVQGSAIVLQQFNLNSDLPAMHARQIAGFLPNEFNQREERAKFDGVIMR